ASPASPARSPARTPAEPPPTPKPTPRPTRPPPPSLELGEPGALHAKLSRPGDLSPLRRVGPWLLTHSGPQALAYREGALAEGAVFLPKGAKALSWDPRAKALFYAQQGKTYRITETGSVETKRPFGFTYIPLGGLTVAVTRKGQLRAFLPSAPSPAAWTLKLPHVPASPLALDLDRDGVPDHLLVCLLEPRALLIDAKGAIRAEIQLPGGVAHSPLLLEAPNGVQQVVVPCAQGVLVRLGVEPYRLSELARLDLLEPLSGPPALVRVRGRPRLIAAVVAGAGLIATSTDLRAVEWVGRRARPGVLSLSGPGVVDLDRDGEPELAIARLQMGGGSRAWLEVHRLDGSWVADLEAGAGDVRVAVGTGPQLVASGPGGLFAWGPWQSLPLPEQDVSLEERVWASLLGGAWERAREGAAELGGARGATYAAFISRHLGEGDRRAEVSRADFEQAFGAMRQAVPNASPWVLDRLFGQQASPRPPLDDLQPLAAVMAPPKGRRRGVVFRGGKTKLHGADALEVARFETQRALFSAGGRLAFRVSLESEQICRIVVKSEVYNVKRTGFAQLELSLDGRHFGGISCMYSIGGEQHVSLGRLAAGTHRIELEVTRSTAVVRLKQVWLETEK
ncbi:MAG: hypothetical protein JKY65_27085, partial [Planctomycetes bacterium]|nr:hypothetical protein [Planctomycetota bacterium]